MRPDPRPRFPPLVATGALSLGVAGLMLAAVLGGHAAPAAPLTADAVAHDAGTLPAAPCATCGVVASVRALETRAGGDGLWALAGGVLGGVIGNRFGCGAMRTAPTAPGAAAGGLAGHEEAQTLRSPTTWRVTVRMDETS